MYGLLVCCFVAVALSFTPPHKAGYDIDEMLCILDPRINATTLTTYKNGTYIKQIQKYLWATACGRSRGRSIVNAYSRSGVFTLVGEEYKGHTYSCAHWPEQWGIKSVRCAIFGFILIIQ